MTEKAGTTGEMEGEKNGGRRRWGESVTIWTVAMAAGSAFLNDELIWLRKASSATFALWSLSSFVF